MACLARPPTRRSGQCRWGGLLERASGPAVSSCARAVEFQGDLQEICLFELASTRLAGALESAARQHALQRQPGVMRDAFRVEAAVEEATRDHDVADV